VSHFGGKGTKSNRNIKIYFRFFELYSKNQTFGRFGRYIKGRNTYLGAIYEPLYALSRIAGISNVTN
jgi:hypothetical protein